MGPVLCLHSFGNANYALTNWVNKFTPQASSVSEYVLMGCLNSINGRRFLCERYSYSKCQVQHTNVPRCLSGQISPLTIMKSVFRSNKLRDVMLF